MKIISIRIHCTTLCTTNCLPTIQISFLVSRRPRFSKRLWFLGVSGEGGIIPSRTFSQGIKLNSDGYLELLLKEKSGENRMTKAKKLLNKVKDPIMKIISVQIHCTRFPKRLCFLCISSESGIIPCSIFSQGFRLNSDGYVEFLNSVVKTSLERVASGRPNVWQQDSIPSHTAGKTQ